MLIEIQIPQTPEEMPAFLAQPKNIENIPDEFMRTSRALAISENNHIRQHNETRTHNWLKRHTSQKKYRIIKALTSGMDVVCILPAKTMEFLITPFELQDENAPTERFISITEEKSATPKYRELVSLMRGAEVSVPALTLSKPGLSLLPMSATKLINLILLHEVNLHELEMSPELREELDSHSESLMEILYVIKDKLISGKIIQIPCASVDMLKNTIRCRKSIERVSPSVHRFLTDANSALQSWQNELARTGAAPAITDLMPALFYKYCPDNPDNKLLQPFQEKILLPIPFILPTCVIFLEEVSRQSGAIDFSSAFARVVGPAISESLYSNPELLAAETRTEMQHQAIIGPLDRLLKGFYLDQPPQEGSCLQYEHYRIASLHEACDTDPEKEAVQKLLQVLKSCGITQKHLEKWIKEWNEALPSLLSAFEPSSLHETGKGAEVAPSTGYDRDYVPTSKADAGVKPKSETPADGNTEQVNTGVAEESMEVKNGEEQRQQAPSNELRPTTRATQRRVELQGKHTCCLLM